VTGSHLKALAALQSKTPVLIALYDQHDRLRFANPAFRAAYHVGPDESPTWAEIMRRNYAAGRGTVLKTDDVNAWIASTAHRRGKVPFRAMETDLHDGRWLWMTETVDADGCMLCIAVYVTTIHAEERELRSHGLTFQYVAALEDAIRRVDVIYVIGTKSPCEVAGKLVLRPEILQRSAPHVRIYHPLPRGIELPTEVDASRKAAYFRQVANGVPVRMAILERLLNGSHQGL